MNPRQENPDPAKGQGVSESGPPDFPEYSPSGGGDPPPELAEIVRSWATLPEALRAGILAMVRAAGTPTLTRDDTDDMDDVEQPRGATKATEAIEAPPRTPGGHPSPFGPQK